MSIAFFAPLQPPGHPMPSGDRAMGRALIAALEAGGHCVTLASDLRLHDRHGDTDHQDALFARARDEVTRLLSDPQAKTWTAWLTYHNYYKAPDLIGPAVARGLGIPYLQVESTRARKRLVGPWARFAAAAEAASDTAHTILYVTERDAETLRRDAPEGQILRHLPPFLARSDLPEPSTLKGAMLSVGMMRAGDKMESYALTARTLASLPKALYWRLEIAGDGPKRDAVAAMMEPFGDRVRLLGALDADTLATKYGQASLLLWPGVNEAFGLSYLEAQAAGVPVVAQNRPGVRDVVHTPLTDVTAGPTSLASEVLHLITHPKEQRELGATARAAVADRHLLTHATNTLTKTLEGLR